MTKVSHDVHISPAAMNRPVRQATSARTYDADMEFSGRNVVVTGAGRGIGAALAREFHVRGATVVVTVKSADGTPLPHATVVVGQGAGTPWADVAPDGVQRLDPYADERGRRVLQRVQPGRVRLDGWWGGWKGTLIVNAQDRQTSEVTLLVR